MFIFINIFLPPADLPWFALAVANLSANLLTLRPEGAPTVRTELRTPVEGPSLTLWSLHAGLGITRPVCNGAFCCYTGCYAAPVRKKLRERLREALAGEGFAHSPGARSTARKRVDRHLTRAFHGVVSQIRHLDDCDLVQVVTDDGTASGHDPGIHIRSASIRGYLNGYWQASTQGSNYSKPSTKVCSNLKAVAET